MFTMNELDNCRNCLKYKLLKSNKFIEKLRNLMVSSLTFGPRDPGSSQVVPNCIYMVVFELEVLEKKEGRQRHLELLSSSHIVCDCT